MLNRIISLSLLVALISFNFSHFFVYAGFELNHKYIAENLCINKSRPWMHCNGKCYFMQKIKQAQENEKKQERSDQKNLYQEGLPVSSAFNSVILKEEISLKITYPHEVAPAIIRRSGFILQPPKIV